MIFRVLQFPFQVRSVGDITSVVDSMIRDGNTSAIFAPVVQKFLPKSDRIISVSPEVAMADGDYLKVPMLTGVVTDDGVLMAYFLKETIDQLRTTELR